MMELKFATKSFSDERSQTRCFHYFLLVDPVEHGNFFCENYGVKVSEENGDSALIRGITASSRRIHELITTLVEHLVGPTVLADVVDDWL